ncbi:hypothetical protein [Dokdonella soli]|uniref:Uncharacterized protein n=1 Tax=Dokdonella soli TaxID=529810 RepID=A0ABN1IQW9_9GAMM
MKTRKHLVVAGAGAADLAEIATFLRVVQPLLDHTWSFAGEDDDIDLVLSDLTDFGGRCARVRALDEGRHFAVLADPGADVLDAELIVHRPISAKAIAGLLNHVGHTAAPGPRRHSDFSAPERRVVVPQVRKAPHREDRPTTAPSTRACFLDIQRVRACTNLDALIQRGAVLLERPGLPALLIDPVTDTFHTSARMLDLEPYFLDAVNGQERRRVGGHALAALRKELPARPLARLRWLHALLRSNGWLAEHLDPSANYRLKRWFQVDTDYRKQHRIALTLMREAPLHRIAASAKAHMADVFDVVNAFDALGLIVATRQPIYGTEAEPGGKRRRSMKKARPLLAATAFTR